MRWLARREARDGSERGFVLIGVVMFVLALTILGISLFGLSSFEAMFLNQSADRDQAFYDALGGLERAKWALATFDSLQSVKNGVPYGDGVVLVTAWKANGDTTGKVDWTGGSGLVGIRVVAIRGKTATTPGERRVIQAKYNPQEIKNLYSNLLTSAGPIWNTLVMSNACMYGSVWQQKTYPDTSWSAAAACGSHEPLTLQTVPIPDVPNFLSQWLPGSTLAPWFDPVMTLDAGVGNIKVFRVPSVFDTLSLGFDFAPDPFKQQTINVTGTAVLLGQSGIAFWQHLTVASTDPNAALVIISGAGTGLDSLGIRRTGILLGGGLDSSVPVILVSEGQVSIHQIQSNNVNTLAKYVSVFAGDIFIEGPFFATMTLKHDPSLDSTVLDPLIDAGLLPNLPPGQNRALVAKAGQWREVNESNPLYN
jgi:hypothetical protein